MRNRELLSKIMSFGMAAALVFNVLPVQTIFAKEITAAEKTAGTGDTVNTANEKENSAKTKNEVLTGNAGTESAETDEKEVIEIATVKDFLSFAEHCFLDAWSADKMIILQNDIDLAGSDFESIQVFTGVFDGKGHTISGFSSTGDGYVAGMFRYIEKNGVVENLNIEGTVLATDEKECIGGLCGVNYGTIRNCSFQGSVSGKTTVGGLAGVNEGTGVIKDCSVSGRITGYYSTGGIAGINHGEISFCKNLAGINNDSAWVEEDDEMGVGLFLSIELGGSGTELFSGVDAGGIAGYSDGIIAACTNDGKIGYEHTGYNIGGIAGRQCGVVSSCTNTGTVYGRKDVGGIVGQMEPYIEVDEAASLRNAVNKLHDLIEKTINDMQAGKNVIKQDIDNLADYGDRAADAAHALAGQMTDFADSNLDQAQAITDRLKQVSNMLPGVFDHIYAAEDSLSAANNVLKGLAGRLKDIDNEELRAAMDDLNTAMEKQQEAIDQVNEIMQEITDADTSATEAQLDDLEEAMKEMLAAASEVTSALSVISGIAGQQISDRLGNDLTNTMNHLQNAVDHLKSGTRDANSIVSYINGQPDIRFSQLGEDFDVNREDLHTQLKGISASIKSMNGNMSGCSDTVSADLLAVNDQLNTVFHLLADHLAGYEEFDAEELYEDVEIEDTDSITTGKVENCTNKAIVAGDINVGGVAGAMSIDEEDPEGNAAGSVAYQIGQRYFTKCIITDCVNEGYITAKKNGAGGIAGYMRHGSVTDSESYGGIESTEGDYVGGICGESLTVIKRCYALCSVSGGRNVGGIAGYADTLQDCYAIASCEASIGRKGAIAGQTADYESVLEEAERKVFGNYYVGDTLYGIDNISYVGIAEPMDYEEMLTVPGIPGQFRHLKVIFRVDDRYLGEQEVKFGESLADLNYPEIPEKEGYYGIWPDYSDQVMVGNLLINGEYKEDVTVVQSIEKQSTDGAEQPERPYALVEQRFTEDTVLDVTFSDMAPPEEAAGREHVIYNISLKNAAIGDGDTFAIRLYNPYEDADVWRYRNGRWIPAESKARGSYLQVDMTGSSEIFCVAEQPGNARIAVLCIAAGAAGILLLVWMVKRMRKKKK